MNIEYSNEFIFVKSLCSQAIEEVASNILRENKDLEALQNIDWKLTVVHSKTANAAVLPVSNLPFSLTHRTA